MRFSLLCLVLLLFFGCTSSETPVTPPENSSASDGGEGSKTAQGSTDGTEKEDPHTPTFNPTPTPDDLPAKEIPEEPAITLTPEMKTAVANLVNADAKIKDQAQVYVDGLNEQSIPVLLAAAKDASADVRAGAVYGLLGRFNPYDARMMQVLLKSLSDENQRVRGLALTAAAQMKPEALASALAALTKILSDSTEPAYVRASAARLLAKASFKELSPSKAEVIASGCFEALKQGLLSDPDRSVRLACLSGVVKQAPSPADAVLVLSEVLDKSTDEVLRRRAASSLGDFGEEAVTAGPVLISALSDKDERVAAAAADALVRIGSPSVPLLAEKALVGEKPARLLAIQALTQLGPAASAGQIQLQQAAQDSDSQIQDAAQAALQAIGK